MLKRNQLLVAVLIAGAATIGSACNCGARLAINGDTTVAITSPADGAQFLLTDTVTVVTKADNAAGLTSLAIEVGTQQLTICNGTGAGDTHIDCSGTFTPNAFSSEIGAGQIVITAAAISAAGIEATATVTIQVGPPFVDAGSPWFLNFLQPSTGSSFPPQATVTTPSTLQLGIAGTPATPIRSIVVTDEHNNNVATFTTTPYSTTIDWATVLGIGNHTLTGVATDTGGETANAILELTVSSTGCTSDATCATGTRCCTDDGICHPIVAENAACDCAHPCPTDEGCFPGTCGKLPQQCRPGCNPGNQTTQPDTCAPVNGVQAYCDPLPPSQVTTANKGGACAPGDGCSVTLQNCPDAPLYPASDAGPPANPIVPYTCEPAGMNGNNEATVCFPSGTHPAQPNNPGNTCEGENDTCGSSTAGCAQGLECVWEENIDGTINTAAGPSCSPQCSQPNDGDGFSCPPQGDCPSGYFCGTLLGNGNQQFTTGVCEPMPQGC